MKLPQITSSSSNDIPEVVFAVAFTLYFLQSLAIFNTLAVVFCVFYWLPTKDSVSTIEVENDDMAHSPVMQWRASLVIMLESLQTNGD